MREKTKYGPSLAGLWCKRRRWFQLFQDCSISQGSLLRERFTDEGGLHAPIIASSNLPGIASVHNMTATISRLWCKIAHRGVWRKNNLICDSCLPKASDLCSGKGRERQVNFFLSQFCLLLKASLSP